MSEVPPSASSAPPPAPLAALRARPVLVVLLPALLAALAYLPSIANGFAYDDTAAIVDNALLHSLGSLPVALQQPYWLSQGHLYRPLTALSWGLEWQLADGRPWLFHLLNVVWHAANTALVARLATRWLPALPALAVGLLFALHPVHAEAVANSVGRSELAATGLLVLVALAVTAPDARADRRRLVRVALLSALALASKEVGVVAPAVALGMALARPVARSAAPDRGRAAWRDAWRFAWPFAAASVAGVLPLLAMRWAVLGTLGGDRQHHAFSAAGALQEWMLVLGALPKAALLLVAPLVPRIDWAPTMAEVRAPSLVLALIGLAGLLAVVVALLRHLHRPGFSTGAVWLTAAALAPTSNLVFRSGVVLTERTLYAPSVGVVLLLGAGLAWLLERGGAARRGAVLATVAWLGAAALITPRESTVWKDNRTLAGVLLERAPRSYRSHLFAASLFREDGRLPEARARYETAVRLFADDAGMLYDYATLLARLGDRGAAERLLARAVAMEPDRRRARTQLALVLLQRGAGDDARRVLEAGVAREPDQRLWRRMLDSLDGRR